jgi:hypothetical protein
MRKVRQVNIDGLSAKKDINISSLPPGIYFIQYATGANRAVMRFMKE